MWERIAGWVFVVSAGIAWYTASAMMLKSTMGRTVLPTGELSREANVPGAVPSYPVEYPAGMPGAKVGQ